MRYRLAWMLVVLVSAPLLGLDSGSLGPAAPATQAATNPKAPIGPAELWGQRAGSFQSQVQVTGNAAKGGALHVVTSLRNVSDKKLPVNNIRVWLMLAQGRSLVFYTAPYTATPQALDAGETVAIVFEAGGLPAFKYAADLEIHDGSPASADPKAAAPQSVGKVSEILPTGSVKLKAFVVVSEKLDAGVADMSKTEVIPSATLVLKVAELAAADLAQLDEPARQAFFAELTIGFQGDAVAAKNAHDRAVKVGTAVTPQLVTLLDDQKLSSAGQMWLAAALVDLHDPHAMDALIKILEKGGAAAQVVAYHGPKIKDAKLTAAIQRIAATTKDAALTAWAVRGLGLNGEKTDGALLEVMVAHSDPAGRAEAAEILAAHSDTKALPLLAKLITDSDATVRVHAIHAAVEHHKTEPVILDALRNAARFTDAETQTAAHEALEKLGSK